MALNRSIGLLLILLGLGVAILPIPIPGLVTVEVDSIAPQILSTFPAHGGIYSIVNGISVLVDDGTGSGVVKVTAVMDSTQTYTLQPSSDPNRWFVTISTPPQGQHILNVRAEDFAGNANNVNVVFEIGQTTLSGKWFINGIEVNQNTAKFVTRSRDLTFTFIMDQQVAISVSNVAVTINCDGIKTPSCLTFLPSTSLPLVDATGKKWEVKRVIPDGKHSIILRASAATAGAGSVTLNVLADIGGDSGFPEIPARVFVGGGISLVGFLIYRRRES